MRQEEEQRAAEERRLRDLGRYRGVLDPVTASLTDFEDKSHLCTKIDQLYERLDVDNSGGLDFDEMQQGIRRLPGGAEVHITRDDFDVISQHGELLGPGGDFGKSQFQDMMLGELLRYSHRKVMNMLQDTEQEEFRALVLLVKMMEIRQGDIARIMTMQEKVLTHLRVDAGNTPRTELTQENPLGPALHDHVVHVHATAAIGRSKRAPEDPALSVEPMPMATPSEGTAQQGLGGLGELAASLTELTRSTVVEVRELAAEIGRERRRAEDRMSEMAQTLIARQDHMLHLLLDATGHEGLEVGEQNRKMREGKRQDRLVTMGLRNESAGSPMTLWPGGHTSRGNTATALDEFTRSNSNGHLCVSASVGHARLVTSHADGESGQDFCPLQRVRDDAWLVQHGVSAPPSASVGHARRVNDEGVQC